METLPPDPLPAAPAPVAGLEAPEAPAPVGQGWPPALRFAGTLLLQLAVVFVGVYAAFALTQLQSTRDQNARRQALRAALAEELGVIVEQGAYDNSGFEEVRQYIAAIDGGAQPPLQPLDTNVPFSPYVWEAALASSGVELLDPKLVIRLSSFYGSLGHLIHQIDQNDETTRALLLPNLDRPTSEFYTAAGQIRPKYQWYRQHIARLSEDVPRLIGEADVLRTELLQ